MSILVNFYSDIELIHDAVCKDAESMSKHINTARGFLGEELKYIRAEYDGVFEWFSISSGGKLESVVDAAIEEQLESELEDIDDLFESGWFEDLMMMELDSINESLDESGNPMRRRVSARGQVRRIKSREVRRRQAVKTTGRSKAQLRRSARKAARTLRRNPAAQRRGKIKRTRALRKRRAMGIRSGS